MSCQGGARGLGGRTIAVVNFAKLDRCSYGGTGIWNVSSVSVSSFMSVILKFSLRLTAENP